MEKNGTKRYDFKIGEGIYTDMDAIRPDEELSYPFYLRRSMGLGKSYI